MYVLQVLGFYLQHMHAQKTETQSHANHTNMYAIHKQINHVNSLSHVSMHALNKQTDMHTYTYSSSCRVEI